MNQLKAFILAVLKIAAAILLSVIALAALGWAIYAVWQGHEAAKNAPLETPKKWSPIRIEALGNVALNLSTMWRGGRLYYKFSVDGYPKALAVARDASGAQPSLSATPAFTLAFLDQNGFKLFEHTISLNEMTKIVDASGQGAGLDANDDTYVAADVYRRASSWVVTWNFGTALPTPEPTASAPKPRSVGGAGGASRPNWRNVSLWRTLKRGMSKEDVRRILGEPGKITELPLSTIWYYGYPLGGDVTFSRQGLVESWSEP